MRSIGRPYTFLLLFLTACAGTGEVANESVLTFIHLNDTYRVDAVEEGRRGGFGRVATVVRRLKEQGNDVQILHGGDFLYPSLESQLWNGEQMVEAMNFLDGLAPMYVVPGNHEFDRRTPEHLANRVKESRFDWLGDNLRFATGDEEADQSLHRAFTFMAGTKKVGVFSLTLHPDDGGNVRDYAPVFSGYREFAEIALAELDADGADLIIGLTHLHLADDIEIAKLKSKYPNFLFIAGGHEHEPEYEQGGANTAAIVKGASNARTIWQIDVSFNDDVPSISTQQIAIDESIPLDIEYQQIADKWRARLLELIPFLPSKIGEAKVRMDAREVTIRNEESNWGDFIADQMRMAFGNPPADFAVINSGTLRIDDFIAEDITFEDIGRTFGFSSFLRTMTMDGGDFRDLLEAGYRGTGPSKGYFPQISGFRVCVDRSRPEGERIVQMLVPDGEGWREIDPGQAYTVVAPDFIFRGGDGYDFSKARDVSKPGSELKYLVLDAVIRATAAGKKAGAVVDPEKPRIAFLAEREDRCFR